MARDRPPTTDEIRRAIDRGETSGKVRLPDSVTAPLATGDEAAGPPPHTAAKEDVHRATADPPPPRQVEEAKRGRGRAAIWTVAVAILIALILIAYGVWSR